MGQGKVSLIEKLDGENMDTVVFKYQLQKKKLKKGGEQRIWPGQTKPNHSEPNWEGGFPNWAYTSNPLES